MASKTVIRPIICRYQAQRYDFIVRFSGKISLLTEKDRKNNNYAAAETVHTTSNVVHLPFVFSFKAFALMILYQNRYNISVVNVSVSCLYCLYAKLIFVNDFN